MSQRFELSYTDYEGEQWTYIDPLSLEDAVKKIISIMEGTRVTEYCIYDLEAGRVLLCKKIAMTYWEKIAQEVDKIDGGRIK